MYEHTYMYYYESRNELENTAISVHRKPLHSLYIYIIYFSGEKWGRIKMNKKEVYVSYLIGGGEIIINKEQ